MTKKITKVATTTTEKPLMDMVADVTVDQASDRMKELDRGFDDRAAFEALHNPANSSIQDKLKGYRAKFVVPGIAALTLAANVDPDFMNRTTGQGNKTLMRP